MGIGKEKSRGGSRKRKPIIIIAAEGKNKTEKNYFKRFNGRDKKYSINFSKGNNTDPCGMIKELKREMAETGDKGFCLIDTDIKKDKQTQIEKAQKKIKNENIELILSNPCFEIWFLCHYTHSSKSFNSCDEVQKKLKKFIPNYEKNQDVFKKLEAKQNHAINNAKKLEELHESLGKKIHSMECNPSTEVYKMVEHIIK